MRAFTLSRSSHFARYQRSEKLRLFIVQCFARGQIVQLTLAFRAGCRPFL